MGMAPTRKPVIPSVARAPPAVNLFTCSNPILIPYDCLCLCLCFTYLLPRFNVSPSLVYVSWSTQPAKGPPVRQGLQVVPHKLMG